MATGFTGVDARGRLLGLHEIPVEERTLRSRLRKGRARLQDLGYELWKSKLATWGATVVLLMVVVAIFADVIDRYDPLDMSADALLPPGWVHWFGTDPYGRDIWSRVVHGARRAMGISASAVLLGVIVPSTTVIRISYRSATNSLTSCRACWGTSVAADP